MTQSKYKVGLTSILFGVLLLILNSKTHVHAHDEWGGKVVTLTDSNFASKVLDSEESWLVVFYAPWCGYCKQLQPIYEEASRVINKQKIGNVKLGAIDATQHQSYAQKFQISGFPTLYTFPAGQKTQSDAKPYKGDRSLESIVQWAKSVGADERKPAEVLQLTNEKVLKDSCGDAQICVISVLPQLFECQSECRQRYIKRLKDVAKAFKSKEWAYLWVEANAQPELEKALDVGGFGYPALAAVNIRKMAFSLMRGSFSTEGITDFLKELSYGHGSSAPLKGAKLPEIVDIKAWDGKDEEIPTYTDEL